MEEIIKFFTLFFCLFIPVTFVAIEISENFIISRTVGKFLRLLGRFLKSKYRHLMKKKFKKRYKSIKEISLKKYKYRFKKVFVVDKESESLRVITTKRQNYSVKTFEINIVKDQPEVKVYKMVEKTKIISM